MVRYMKCPRCELNYIDAEKQEYCDICLKELQGIPSETEELDFEDDEMSMELCPICGENEMRAGEKMCEECRKKSVYDEEPDDEVEDDEEWRNYLDDDADVDLDEEIEIDETFDEEFDEELEEEEYSSEEEDLEYVTGDDIYSLGDDEDDEDDDRDDDF